MNWLNPLTHIRAVSAPFQPPYRLLFGPTKVHKIKEITKSKFYEAGIMDNFVTTVTVTAVTKFDLNHEKWSLSMEN